MSDPKEKPDTLNDRAARVAREMAALAAETARVDPALRARLEAALAALNGSRPVARNTALLENPARARAVVRDTVAEELERYWERRFGGRP